MWTVTWRQAQWTVVYHRGVRIRKAAAYASWPMTPDPLRVSSPPNNIVFKRQSSRNHAVTHYYRHHSQCIRNGSRQAHLVSPGRLGSGAYPIGWAMSRSTHIPAISRAHFVPETDSSTTLPPGYKNAMTHCISSVARAAEKKTRRRPREARSPGYLGRHQSYMLTGVKLGVMNCSY